MVSNLKTDGMKMCWDIEMYSEYQPARTAALYLQADPSRRIPELTIINHAVIYPRKWNSVNIYICRCGCTRVTEDPEIGFLPSGETGRHDDPCSRMSRPAWLQGLQYLHNSVNRASRYKIRASKHTVLHVFVLSLNYLVIYKCSRSSPPSESPCRSNSYCFQRK
jgi:hypothetical protein